MLTCGACRERFLQNLINNSLFSTPPRPSTASNFTKDPFSRTFYTKPNRKRRTSLIIPSRRKASQSFTARRPERQLPNGFHIRRQHFKLEQAMGAVFQKHPNISNDPLKLAELVQKSLRGDDFETAITMARAASSNVQCTVAWNHLIDWQLSKGKMNAALKTYNEMKKRGQPPDSHTFTIIINGCSKHKDVVQGLVKVLAVFKNMQTDRSPVKPNTIHLNAVLKMCARAKDMETMFSVVAQMPYSGPSSPDNVTYTTVINALQINAATGLRDGLTSEQEKDLVEKAILNARHIWRDIIKRWQKGGLWIDEELVCAMGRLMILGQSRDRDDILSLIEQTMNIPRQSPRMAVPYQTLTPRTVQVQPVKQTSKAPSVGTEGSHDEPYDEPSEDSTEVFAMSNVLPMGATNAYAKPGRRTLGLVMATLRLMQNMKDPADKYWQIFTQQIGVKPDMENYHAYLRILRIFRSSTQTVELLESIPYADMRTATFRLAIAACERDKRNRYAFSNAGKIVDIMQSALQVPDIQVLTSYLEVAMSATTEAKGGPELNKLSQGKQIMRALNRLKPHFQNAKSFLIFGEGESDMTGEERGNYKTAVLQLTQRMVAAYDVLMDKALVERSKYSELTQERSQLAAFITRQKNQQIGGIGELPSHLLHYVYGQKLHKVMAKAQFDRKSWQNFVERCQRDYDSNQQQAGAAKEMQKDHASDKPLEVVEVEGRTAEPIAQGAFANYDGRSRSKLWQLD